MRLERASGATANVVAQQTFLHLDASLAIQDRLLVSALLPIALAQAGDSPEVDGRTLVSPKQAEIGDLRLGLRVRMFGFDDNPLQVGVGAYLYLPTAKSGGFAGEGSVREAPHFVAGGRFELGIPFVWTSTVGVLVRSSENPSMLTYGAGLAALVAGDHLHFGGEIHASTPLQDGSYTISDSIKVPANQTTNAELLGEVRGRIIGGLVVGVAAGPGLSHAIRHADVSLRRRTGLVARYRGEAERAGRHRRRRNPRLGGRVPVRVRSAEQRRVAKRLPDPRRRRRRHPELRGRVPERVRPAQR